MLTRSAAIVLASLAAGQAHADLYGFVDERGVAHFANAPLDHRIPPYPETRSYVPKVLQHYHLYADAHQ